MMKKAILVAALLLSIAWLITFFVAIPQYGAYAEDPIGTKYPFWDWGLGYILTVSGVILATLWAFILIFSIEAVRLKKVASE